MQTSRYFLLLAGIALVTAGCANTEQKFSRGVNNITEFARGGEIRRSMEQSALFQSPSQANTGGFVHGFNRSIARTFVGAYEIVTAPFPSYEPIMKPVSTVYPDNYTPDFAAGSLYETDARLGFSGGYNAPWFPGSQFSVFDN